MTRRRVRAKCTYMSVAFVTDFGGFCNVADLAFVVVLRVGVGCDFVEFRVVGARPSGGRSVRVLVVIVTAGTSTVLVDTHKVVVIVSTCEVAALDTSSIV